MKCTIVSVDRNWAGIMDLEYNIRPNFKVKEFICKDGTNVVLVSTQTLDWLQEIRDKVGKPLKVNSEHRTYYHNAKVGGKKNSQHLYGRAVDIAIPYGIDPDKFYRIVCSVIGNDRGGIGRYDTFCHIDSRSGRSRW